MSKQRLSYTAHGVEFRELVTLTEMHEAYRFRYEMCVEQLHWVEGDPERRLEIDQWDRTGYHFGAYIDGKLMAYLREVPDTDELDIMSRACFGDLFKKPQPNLPRSEVADISRLIVRPQLMRNKKLFMRILFGLYRLAYGRARLEGLRYWYFVTSKREIQALRYKGFFPVRVYGHGRTPDGKETYVAILDLNWARVMVGLLSPHRLVWFESAASYLAPILGSTEPVEAPAPPETVPIATPPGLLAA